MTSFFNEVKAIIGKLALWIVATAAGTLATILMPVLSIVMFLHALHTGEGVDKRLAVMAFVLLGPLSSAFWFSGVWKGFRKEGLISGLPAAAGRMFVGLVLSVGSLVLATNYIQPHSQAESFVYLWFAVYAPVLILIPLRLMFGGSPKCVCNGEACYMPDCKGTVKRGFCTECHADYCVV
jgi:hypothetical protein